MNVFDKKSTKKSRRKLKIAGYAIKRSHFGMLRGE